MTNMYIFLLTQTSNRGYDTYDSCVVIASGPEAASLMHPDEDKKWLESMGKWGMKYDYNDEWFTEHDEGCWAPPDEVKVTLIGRAKVDYDNPKVVCASFKAG